MYSDWPVLALAFGLGIILALAVTLPLLGRAWGAYRREQDYNTALRVAGILADIKRTQATADEPDAARQRDVAEATLFGVGKIIKDAQRLQDWAAHIAQGGQADDPPSLWKGLPKP